MDRPDVEHIKQWHWSVYFTDRLHLRVRRVIRLLCDWILFLEEKDRWIPIGERLPDDTKKVSVCGPSINSIGYHQSETDHQNGGWWTALEFVDELRRPILKWSFSADSFKIITHWRERPPAPKVGR